ncbi:MAG: phosphonate ABC transporter, permease protein PhnE [Elioraea sp.]|nr:phosphonate ABC transporter, permease protein PhnE [Elioraea sp.]MDW8442874.1 phosphonate ABC transporter, permease protein PhnE [Acetobacteraceae bacterium]
MRRQSESSRGCSPEPPPRWQRPSAFVFLAWLGALALLVSSFAGAEVSAGAFVSGLPAMGRFLAAAFPPDPSRLDKVLIALAETFQMAVAGTTIGVVLALPLAVLAASTLSPSRLAAAASRALIALFRTIPDLVWALIFVVAVGLGPFAGTLALAVDGIGFCGRFFAEAMEEADPGPQEALAALGAGRAGIIVSAVLPAAFPSMIATTLFALEKATRSSVVLGLVGAGGIGMELKVAMDFFNYAEAATILVAVFLLVVAVEQGAGRLRAAILR